MPHSRRKKSSLINDLWDFLLAVPGWVGPIVAFCAFAGFRWIVPWLFNDLDKGNETIKIFVPLASKILVQTSPMFGLFVLLLWMGAELKKYTNRKRLDSQGGIDTIRELNWLDFEALLSEAFRRRGYNVEQIGGAGPDGGVDLRLLKSGKVTFVQCKQWRTRKVGVKVVRELLGVVTSSRADAGIVVASGDFTNDAIKFADDNPIDLIDGKHLEQLIGSLQSGV